jgi:hypothetical protein
MNFEAKPPRGRGGIGEASPRIIGIVLRRCMTV